MILCPWFCLTSEDDRATKALALFLSPKPTLLFRLRPQSTRALLTDFILPTSLKMCGIHAIITSSTSSHLDSSLKARLCSRGPDHFGTITTQLADASLTFTSTVLALRGDHIARQPLVDETTGSVLCWNGEAWKIRGKDLEVNDTDAVFEELVQATQRRVEGDADPVLEALREVQGPFAFVFLDQPARRVYFGRDRLGRRSLLMNNNGGLTLSSVAETASEAWSEVEADGCYYVSLDQMSSDGRLDVTRLPWTEHQDLVSDDLLSFGDL